MTNFVVIESPWAGLGGGEKAQRYLRACIRDVLSRNEIPWASHAMLAWTEALYDDDPEQRSEGLEVNKRVIERADLVAFYVDFGMSPGMKLAWKWAKYRQVKAVSRTIYK
jgi:hypothetical protein